MTNEEAIKVLAQSKWLTSDNNRKLYPAIMTAIKALMESSLFGNCDGCRAEERELCMRYPKRPDMYDAR